MQPGAEITEVFIVRLWREPRGSASAPFEWRGMVEHVGSGQRRYFAEPNEIVRIITERLGDSDKDIE